MEEQDHLIPGGVSAATAVLVRVDIVSVHDAADRDIPADPAPWRIPGV